MTTLRGIAYLTRSRKRSSSLDSAKDGRPLAMTHKVDAVFTDKVPDKTLTDAKATWNSDQCQLFEDGQPDPNIFIDHLKRYYPKYKNNIRYIGRGIFAINKNDIYYIVAESHIDDMRVTDFLEDTDCAGQFPSFADIKSYYLKIHIYNDLKPDKDFIWLYLKIN